MSIPIYAFVSIAAKNPFLLTSSLVKPPPPMSGFVSISPPLPPRVLTSYVNGPKQFDLDFHVSYHNIGYGPPKNIHIWLGHESGQGQAQPISRGRGGREEGKGSSLYYYLSSYGGLVREIFFQYTDNISSTKIAHVFISYLLFKNCFLSVFTP